MTRMFSAGSLRRMALLVLLDAVVAAQTVAHSPSAGGSNPADHALELAAKGDCAAAMPALKKQTPRITDKKLKYRAQMAIVRCAMTLKDDQSTVNALFDLKRDSPLDPEVLYMTTQIFLEIALRASQTLTAVAPYSYQSRELQAETLESQNKWNEAADIYRKILEENPKLRGIHFRIGRAELSQPESPTSAEAAKKEFEQELAIDPVNAAAEFWLGEIARRDGQWESAIPHFVRATTLDSKFGQAFLALGMTLNSAGRFADAVSPLEHYIQIDPGDPAGHYQLSIAYARTGRKADSARELTLQQKLYDQRQGGADAQPGSSPQ